MGLLTWTETKGGHGMGAALSCSCSISRRHSVWSDWNRLFFLSASGRSLAGGTTRTLSFQQVPVLSHTHLSILLDPMHGLVNSLVSFFFQYPFISSTHPPLPLFFFPLQVSHCPIPHNPSSSAPFPYSLTLTFDSSAVAPQSVARSVHFGMHKVEPKQSNDKNKPCPPLFCLVTVHPLSRNTFLFVGG